MEAQDVIRCHAFLRSDPLPNPRIGSAVAPPPRALKCPGDHRLSRWLGMLPLKRLGLGLLGPVALFPGVPVELLADGSLAEPDRCRDLGLRLIVLHHPRDDLTVLHAEVADVFRHC